ncbi:hypothetical protein SteCoe_23349 [Stentor coeruleus]|uniref:Uncharacterized protein n=1 Tax=Stentor coeruleus TaxID=5963 RepID=A0A1R2BK21_9CILI|nr:hypothetical protein SteCoe_23349 [Stentor coeruleus]
MQKYTRKSVKKLNESNFKKFSNFNTKIKNSKKSPKKSIEYEKRILSKIDKNKHFKYKLENKECEIKDLKYEIGKSNIEKSNLEQAIIKEKLEKEAISKESKIQYEKKLSAYQQEQSLNEKEKNRAVNKANITTQNQKVLIDKINVLEKNNSELTDSVNKLLNEKNQWKSTEKNNSNLCWKMRLREIIKI